MNNETDEAAAIMESVADWLEEIMPDGKVNLYGIPGDYQMLVFELRHAALKLKGQDTD